MIVAPSAARYPFARPRARISSMTPVSAAATWLTSTSGSGTACSSSARRGSSDRVAVLTSISTPPAATSPATIRRASSTRRDVRRVAHDSSTRDAAAHGTM